MSRCRKTDPFLAALLTALGGRVARRRRKTGKSPAIGPGTPHGADTTPYCDIDVPPDDWLGDQGTEIDYAEELGTAVELSIKDCPSSS